MSSVQRPTTSTCCPTVLTLRSPFPTFIMPTTTAEVCTLTATPRASISGDALPRGRAAHTKFWYIYKYLCYNHKPIPADSEAVSNQLAGYCLCQRTNIQQSVPCTLPPSRRPPSLLPSPERCYHLLSSLLCAKSLSSLTRREHSSAATPKLNCFSDPHNTPRHTTHHLTQSMLKDPPSTRHWWLRSHEWV